MSLESTWGICRGVEGEVIGGPSQWFSIASFWLAIVLLGDVVVVAGVVCGMVEVIVVRRAVREEVCEIVVLEVEVVREMGG